MAARVLVSLGSNLGDRESALRSAVARLGALPGTRVTRCSHCYETEPMGVTEQPPFLNAAAAIETDFAPLELLRAVKQIEADSGRVQRERWGPRLIDIDLILWDGLVLESEGLTLPHAAFRERAFVLVPLAEIAPDHVDPVTGQTVAQLAALPAAKGRVERREALSP